MSRTYVLKTDRKLFSGGFVPAGTIVRPSFKNHYGLIGDDERATGKQHQLVELMDNNPLSKTLEAFTVPTEDLIPL